MLHPPQRRFALHAISFVLALALLGGLLAAAFRALAVQWDWPVVWTYRKVFLDGWVTTLLISALALPVSCLLGLLLALARRSAFLPLNYTAKILVELTRGTPLLAQIYIYFYVIANVLHLENRYIVGPLVLALFAGSYVSEIIRAGIESVGRSQLESARAIGLTRFQTYRHVIFPQAIRQMLPPLAGQFVTLVKDSSLLSIISLEELTKAAADTGSNTYTHFECYLALAVGYLIITLPIALWTQRLERRLRFDT